MMKKVFITLICFLLFAGLHAEKGYRLWLRYDKIDDAKLLSAYQHSINRVNFPGDNPTLQVAKKELLKGLEGLLDKKIINENSVSNGTIICGTPESSAEIKSFFSTKEIGACGSEGFTIKTASINKKKVILIAAKNNVGILYGVFTFLRLLQTHQSIEKISITSVPKIENRVLNHWDNLDRYVERGYAEIWLWDWQTLPDYIDQRYIDYARANASIGINGTVLTNVNANSMVLTKQYLVKVKALADVFRTYGIKVFLTARFSSPVEIGGLKTADPLDPQVQKWWNEKADEIYSYIPDFGGFLVKANSEGQPGPQNYGRTHADGANMYVGGPRNYKWINTNNIARVWEQMHLAYSYGVDRIWIVNVGDLKPMELPISFFLDYAWNTKKTTVDNIGNYYTEWASQQFGKTYAKQIGDILQKYSQYTSRRKPELLSPETYSLTDYNEADRVINQYHQLVEEAEKINSELPSEYKDAYFELVLFPVKAFVNLNEIYVAVAKNRQLASENNIAANKYANKAKEFYKRDSLLSYQYNHELANGKWNHMMDQTHIGYTYWQQPPVNNMPEVKYVLDNTQKTEPVKIDVRNKTSENLIPKNAKRNIFYEKNGYVSIEAANYSKAVNTENIKWKVIPTIGKDGDGITTFPVTVKENKLTNGNPYLQYDIYVYDTGTVKLNAYFSPTLNFENDSLGLQYAISIDNEKRQIVSITKDDKNERTWEKWVANNIIIKTIQHQISKPGKHIVKYWRISPAVILQKIVLDFGGLKSSYLGPQETIFKSKNN